MVDWVSVSQSGAFTLILWDAGEASESNPYNGDGSEHYGVEVYDTQTLNFQRRLWHYGNHGDLCVDTDGEEVYVQFNGPSRS